MYPKLARRPCLKRKVGLIESEPKMEESKPNPGEESSRKRQLEDAAEESGTFCKFSMSMKVELTSIKKRLEELTKEILTKRSEDTDRMHSTHAGGHFAGKCTIVLADTGKVHPELIGKITGSTDILSDFKEFVEANAPMTPSPDFKEFVEDFNADAMVRVDELTPDGPKWDIASAHEWKYTKIENLNDRLARFQMLRRALPCSQEICIILVRIIKCRTERVHPDQDSDHSSLLFQYDEDDRKTTAWRLFKKLQEARIPTLVLGDTGIDKASLLRYFEEYKTQTNFDIAAETHVFMNPNQRLTCISRKWRNQTVNQLALDARRTADRLLIIQVANWALCDPTAHSGWHQPTPPSAPPPEGPMRKHFEPSHADKAGSSGDIHHAAV